MCARLDVTRLIRPSFLNPSALRKDDIVSDKNHQFKIGQMVDLIPTLSRAAADGHYEIVSLVPTSASDPQYRIKSKNEKHLRVVSEMDLKLALLRDSVFSVPI